MSCLSITSLPRLKSSLKETVSPNSVGSIVSMKGLSSTQGIVFFKGESGYLGDHRMPTHRPLDREKTRPKKEGKKAKQKRRQNTSQPQLYFLFQFVSFKNRPDGCQQVGTETQGGEGVCVFVCVSDCGCECVVSMRLLVYLLYSTVDICVSLTLTHNSVVMAVLFHLGSVFLPV